MYIYRYSMTQNLNPLTQYFRRPVIYLKLPSGGDFWPDDSLELPENKELPVYPMTAIDEITYRTPDALFNGQAVISVIQSCIPGIKNAWAAPVSDINAILVAIRIASYGHELDINSICPKCSTDSEYTLDLRSVLDLMSFSDYKSPLNNGNLIISFQPVNYLRQQEFNKAQFEEQKLIQVISDSELPDSEKIERLNEALKKITKLTVSALKWSILSIKTPTSLVTDPDYIEEFLINCDRKLFNQIRDSVVELRQSSDLKPINVKCNNCSHEYQQPLTLDMANFFEPAS
jgi:hypothetical protein